MNRGMIPAHPGGIVKETIEGIREETGGQYTLAEIADGIEITRKTLSNILIGHQGVRPQMSVRLSEAFGTSTLFWIDIQRSCDLWNAEQTVERKSVRQFRPIK